MSNVNVPNQNSITNVNQQQNYNNNTINQNQQQLPPRKQPCPGYRSIMIAVSLKCYKEMDLTFREPKPQMPLQTDC